MALGERFRGSGTRGIARFLAEHQHCDAGFDVRREDEPGSGRLRITCLGCGQTIAYRAAEAGELAAAGVDLGAPNGDVPASVEPVAPPPQPAAVAPPPGVRPVGGLTRRPQPISPAPYRRGIPGWIPVLLIGALIIGGLVMIVIGLTRSDSEQAGSGPATPAESKPAPGGGKSEQPAQPAEQAPAPQEGEGGTEAPAGGAVALDKRTFLDRFEIGVPAGWEAGSSGENVVLKAPGGVAAVSIVTQQGEFPDSALTQGARSFLTTEHAGADLGSAERVRLGGRPATSIRATYPGGVDTAYALSAGGVSYLISNRSDRGASAEISAQADAAVQSFKPL